MKALGPSLLLHGFKPPALPCPWVGDTVGMGGGLRDGMWAWL